MKGIKNCVEFNFKTFLIQFDLKVETDPEMACAGLNN